MIGNPGVPSVITPPPVHYQSFIINNESLFFMKNLVRSLEQQKDLFINEMLFPLY